MHLLYKYPGTNPLEDGNRYAWKVFPTIEAGLAEGWSVTYSQAFEKVNKEDEKPLTRAELVELAKKHGVQYDGRISDKRLAELIWATAKDNS